MKRLISLLLLFCIGLPLLAQQQRPAQTPKRDQKKKEVAEIDTIPLYNGTYVGVDLYGIGSKLLGGDFMSSEVSVAVNLKNKFIPTIEFGMGGTDTGSKRPYRHLYIRNRDERPYRLERAGSFLTYELPCGSSVPEIIATSHDRRGYGKTGIRTDIGHGEYLSVTPDYPSYQRDKEKGDYSSFP